MVTFKLFLLRFQQTVTYSKSAIEIQEQRVKYVQSEQ